MKTILNSIIVILLSGVVFSSCSTGGDETKKDKKDENVPKQDSAAPVDEKNWLDVQSSISRMDSSTSYEQIVDVLGKPYDEYATPSLPEEYILFYDVPGVSGAFYWIILDTKTKTFLYWSGEKGEK